VRQTPLHKAHLALGGRVVDFHGWALPVQFAGILHEHRHTREKVSLFDCSHMGEFRISGEDAIRRFERLVTSDLDALRVGRGRYGAILNERAGIVDDIISIRLSDSELLVVTNAGPLDEVAGLLSGPGVDNLSDMTAKIDVQGPMARRVMVAAGFPEAAHLRYFDACPVRWQGEKAVLTRMGYTGELGYEIYLPSELAPALWQRLLEEEDTAPAGLGARDTLRLEMGYPLSGQDIDPSRTPVEAGQCAFVAWQKSFTGREALVAQRDRRDHQVLTGIRSAGRQAPRHGYEVFDNGEPIGIVTSGTYGPTVGHGVGLAYLPLQVALARRPLTAGPKLLTIEPVELPFYKHGTCRNQEDRGNVSR
jgi:aminomethyltransferase